MGRDVGGPSASQLNSMAGHARQPPDTGMAMGAGLMDMEMGYRTKYAEPSRFNKENIEGGGSNIAGYNYQGPLPVKYTTPSPQKDRLVAREALREVTNAQRVDAITDEEVSYLQSMKDQAELADFDRYVNTLVDPRKPGNLKWLMEIYPDFVTRRIQQVNTDYEYALRNQMIDSWGINTFDDLHFKYLVDNGKIKGPNLANTGNAASKYAPGFLSPFNSENGQFGLHLPFASARVGRKPDNRGDWKLDGENQPMGINRDGSRTYKGLATGMANHATDANHNAAETAINYNIGQGGALPR